MSIAILEEKLYVISVLMELPCTHRSLNLTLVIFHSPGRAFPKRFLIRFRGYKIKLPRCDWSSIHDVVSSFWLPSNEMRTQKKTIMMYKTIHVTARKYMMDMFTEQLGPRIYNLRNSKNSIEIPAARTFGMCCKTI